MTPEERIERLESAVGTLVTWLHGTLSTGDCNRLLALLAAPPKDPARSPQTGDGASAEDEVR